MSRTKQLIKVQLATDSPNCVVVDLTYQMGGMNYFSGKNERRGYYLSVRPETQANAGTYTTKQFQLGQGFKLIVDDAARFNRGKFDRLAEDPRVIRLAKETVQKCIDIYELEPFAGYIPIENPLANHV